MLSFALELGEFYFLFFFSLQFTVPALRTFFCIPVRAGP